MGKWYPAPVECQNWNSFREPGKLIVSQRGSVCKIRTMFVCFMLVNQV